LTQRAGDEVTGVRAPAVSMPVAAIVATFTVGPSVVGQLDWQLLIAGFGLAVLMPVIPFSLELLALRRLTAAAFGTLMSLEPAIALIIGFAALGQALERAPSPGSCWWGPPASAQRQGNLVEGETVKTRVIADELRHHDPVGLPELLLAHEATLHRLRAA
jgi:hypothetical protein